MRLINFTPEIARQIDIPHVDGIYVVQVSPRSAADRASITEGTIIHQVNKTPVSSLTELENVIKAMPRNSRNITLIVQEPDGSIARKVIRLR